MDKTKPNEDNALSYHYKETVRLANICDSYAKGAFEDFKLLAAVGGILTWKPIHDAFNLGGPNDSNLLFLGFVAILLIVALVGIINLQKQLIVDFYLEQLQYFESEIRSLLGNEDSPTFRVAENWRTRTSHKQRQLGLLFFILFYIAAITPTFLLDFDDYGFKYLGIAVAVIAVHIGALIIIYRNSHLTRDIPA